MGKRCNVLVYLRVTFPFQRICSKSIYSKVVNIEPRVKRTVVAIIYVCLLANEAEKFENTFKTLVLTNN